MNTFKLNGKTVTAKPVTFNTVVEFEKYGISIEEMGEKKFSLMQIYTAICLGVSAEDAGMEIDADPNALGNIMEAFAKEVEESGFFRNLNKTEETKATTSKGKN